MPVINPARVIGETNIWPHPFELLTFRCSVRAEVLSHRLILTNYSALITCIYILVNEYVLFSCLPYSANVTTSYAGMQMT